MNAVSRIGFVGVVLGAMLSQEQGLAQDTDILPEQLAKHYLKNFDHLVPELPVNLPDQLSLGYRNSRIELDDMNINFKTFDPFGGLVIEKENSLIELDKDSLKLSFKKTLEPGWYNKK